MRVATQAFHLEVAIAGVQRVADGRRWRRRPSEAEHARVPSLARQAVGILSSRRCLFRFRFDSARGEADEQSLQVGVQVRPPTISRSIAGPTISGSIGVRFIGIVWRRRHRFPQRQSPLKAMRRNARLAFALLAGR